VHDLLPSEEALLFSPQLSGWHHNWLVDSVFSLIVQFYPMLLCPEVGSVAAAMRK
jgi:hypothetical protein